MNNQEIQEEEIELSFDERFKLAVQKYHYNKVKV